MTDKLGNIIGMDKILLVHNTNNTRLSLLDLMKILTEGKLFLYQEQTTLNME